MTTKASIVRETLDEQLVGVFLRRGYEGATLAHLADAAGLSKASLYHHYPGGKVEMAGALLRRSCAQAQSLAFDKLAASAISASADERLCSFLDGFERYTEHGTRPCLVTVLAQAAEGDFAKQARLALDHWRAQLAATCIELHEERPKRGIRMAEQILGELLGALLTAIALNEPKLLTRAVKRWRKLVKSAGS